MLKHSPLLVLTLVTSLPANAAPTASQGDLTEFEQYYRAAFRTTAIESCLASAVETAKAGFDVTPTCACAADAFLAKKSLKQLVELAGSDAPKAELAGITADCVTSHPPVKAKR